MIKRIVLIYLLCQITYEVTNATTRNYPDPFPSPYQNNFNSTWVVSAYYNNTPCDPQSLDTAVAHQVGVCYVVTPPQHTIYFYNGNTLMQGTTNDPTCAGSWTSLYAVTLTDQCRPLSQKKREEMRELELLPRGIQSTEAWNYNTVNVTQGLPSYAQYFQNGVFYQSNITCDSPATSVVISTYNGECYQSRSCMLGTETSTGESYQSFCGFPYLGTSPSNSTSPPTPPPTPPIDISSRWLVRTYYNNTPCSLSVFEDAFVIRLGVCAVDSYTTPLQYAKYYYSGDTLVEGIYEDPNCNSSAVSVQQVSVDATCRSVGKRAETYTNQELSVLSTRDVNNWHYVSSVVQEGFPDYAPSFGSSVRYASNTTCNAFAYYAIISRDSCSPSDCYTLDFQFSSAHFCYVSPDLGPPPPSLPTSPPSPTTSPPSPTTTVATAGSTTRRVSTVSNTITLGSSISSTTTSSTTGPSKDNGESHALALIPSMLWVFFVILKVLII